MPPGCTLGYDFSCESGCHFLCQTQASRLDADVACTASGGYLAVMRDAPEDICVRAKMLELGTSFAWIGLTQNPGGNEVDGSWIWDRASSYYDGWAADQPDDGLDTFENMEEDCALQAASGWIDWDCDSINPYLCER